MNNIKQRIESVISKIEYGEINRNDLTSDLQEICLEIEELEELNN